MYLIIKVLVVVLITIYRQIHGLSSTATHQKTSAARLPGNRLRIIPSRIQATGSIEVRGEGSALGQRQGVAMWQRSHLRGDLAFTRLLEKLGRSGCPLSPFPSPATITWGLRCSKSCCKSSVIEGQDKQAQGYRRYSKHPFRCSNPRREPQCMSAKAVEASPHF